MEDMVHGKMLKHSGLITVGIKNKLTILMELMIIRKRLILGQIPRRSA